MQDKALPIIAIVASLVAIIVSISGKEQNANSTSSAELDRLEQRLQRLESRLIRSNPSESTKLSGLKNTDVVVEEDAALAAIEDKQTRLEAELNELGVFDHFEAKKRKIEASYATATDSSAGAKDRLGALKVLREAQRIDETVVASMVSMWQESLDDEKGGGWTRWFLMENIEGIRSPEFRDSILEWIPEEPSPKMRAQGVETLGSMMPDPNVEEWLDYLGESDPEPHIRELAVKVRNRAPTELEK